MWIEMLFAIAKRQKQPKCLPADEQVNKLWHIRTIEYYLVMKKEWDPMPAATYGWNVKIWVKYENYTKWKGQM